MLNEFSSVKDGINFSALPTREPFKSEIRREAGGPTATQLILLQK